MKRLVAVAILVAGVLLAGLPAAAAGQHGSGSSRPTRVPVVFTPYFVRRCETGIYWWIRPHFFQLTLSESRGCSAGGPGTFLTMSRWAHWNRTNAFGYGRWQSSIFRTRVLLWRTVRTAAHGGWWYFSRISVRWGPHWRKLVRARWSWKRGQWVFSRSGFLNATPAA